MKKELKLQLVKFIQCLCTFFFSMKTSEKKKKKRQWPFVVAEQIDLYNLRSAQGCVRLLNLLFFPQRALCLSGNGKEVLQLQAVRFTYLAISDARNKQSSKCEHLTSCKQRKMKKTTTLIHPVPRKCRCLENFLYVWLWVKSFLHTERS